MVAGRVLPPGVGGSALRPDLGSGSPSTETFRGTTQPAPAEQASPNRAPAPNAPSRQAYEAQILDEAEAASIRGLSANKKKKLRQLGQKKAKSADKRSHLRVEALLEKQEDRQESAYSQAADFEEYVQAYFKKKRPAAASAKQTASQPTAEDEFADDLGAQDLPADDDEITAVSEPAPHLKLSEDELKRMLGITPKNRR